jgi:D-serine deaminase-like pyridoxal phosphate-dependent protein
MVSMVPNHVCPVVNLVDELVIVRGGEVVGPPAGQRPRP